MIKEQHSSFLYLEDGTHYQGWSFSNVNISLGELVFNTGMTGYQEVITDPSYYKQMILFTYPEIGNTGVNTFDIESNIPSVRGVISKNICLNPSNWRSSLSLVDYLVKYKIPHIFGLDTRSLTKNLRDKGVMMGCISNKRLVYSELSLLIKSFKSSLHLHPVKNVTTKKQYKWLPSYSNWLDYTLYYSNKPVFSKTILNIVVVDYGVKFNILNRLYFYGCNVIVVSASTDYNNIVSLKPDGVLLSNGPGDPALIGGSVINTVKKLISSNIPIFGICLGHQLLSLAIGSQTRKLKFGHRGLNHPSGAYNVVKITSQNHGYVVLNNLSKNKVNTCYLNFNDETISGIVYKQKPCFSVQYHPEASPGPHDSDFLFAHFIRVVSAFKTNSP